MMLGWTFFFRQFVFLWFVLTIVLSVALPTSNDTILVIDSGSLQNSSEPTSILTGPNCFEYSPSRIVLEYTYCRQAVEYFRTGFFPGVESFILNRSKTKNSPHGSAFLKCPWQYQVGGCRMTLDYLGGPMVMDVIGRQNAWEVAFRIARGCTYDPMRPERGLYQWGGTVRFGAAYDPSVQFTITIDSASAADPANYTNQV